MKRPSVHDIVFKHQFPSPKANEAQNFYSHVQRNLVPEVRVEVQTFYGALDSLEAQYPGLDYTYEPHRRRLSRFSWHRRLFRVFDQLNLTSDEILSICQWEGTKSAKDKYEAETGRIILDTTMDGMAVTQRSEPCAVVHTIMRRQPSTDTMAHVEILDEVIEHEDHYNDEEEEEEVEGLEASVGAQLNDQLMGVEDGDSPNEGSPLEEWLKYMHDREVDRDSILQAIRAGHPPPTALENLSTNSAVGNSEVITSASPSMIFSPLHTLPSASHDYGQISDEILPPLQESRVQA